MNYQCHINESANVATFEVRLMVLTSQMEDMNFRVAILPIDPYSKNRLDDCVVLSEPIRVVSKPEQARRGQPSIETLANPRKKRSNPATSITDDSSVNDYLCRLESQVNQQQDILTKLCETTQLNQIQNSNILRLLNESKVQQDQNQPDFETAYQLFSHAYLRCEPSERPIKLRRLLSASNQEGPLADIIQVVNCHAPTSDVTWDTSPSSCSCKDCPHKKELDNMENFFSIMGSDD